MKIFALGAALITLGLAGASSAAAADLPVCPPDDETLDTATPSYLRVDESFKVSIESGTGTNIVVQVGEQVIPLTQDAAGEAVAIVNGPTELGTLDIVFSWDQDLGTTQACHGIDASTLPVIPAEGKAGDPDAARLTGKYDVTYRRAGFKDTVRWTVKPRCAFFGCGTRLDSTGGYHGLLTPEDGHYSLKPRHSTQGYCTLTYTSGRKVIVRPLVHVTESLEFKPTKVDDDGVVQRFTGTQVLRYVSTSHSRNAGCRKVDTQRRYTVAGVRR